MPLITKRISLPEKRKKGRPKREKSIQQLKLNKAITKGTYIKLEEDNTPCCICNKPIKKGQGYEILPSDINNPERMYHSKTCSPGSENWYKFHPSEIAKLLYTNNLDKRRQSDRKRTEGKNEDYLSFLTEGE